ncbi:MAG: hypothetical protein JST00_07000 [Deltaproteobacteria bacterium]|nr:hypothetical protein [Deltaproteobacteria bacterium]
MAATDINVVTRFLRRLVEPSVEAPCTERDRVAAIGALRSALSMRAEWLASRPHGYATDRRRRGLAIKKMPTEGLPWAVDLMMDEALTLECSTGLQSAEAVPSRSHRSAADNDE